MGIRQHCKHNSSKHYSSKVIKNIQGSVSHVNTIYK